MKYKFDSKTGSFFNYEPETGKTWENHIWTKTPYGYFLTTVGHQGGSISHLLCPTSERIYLSAHNVHCADLAGRAESCVYVRDEATKKYFAIGDAPTYTGVSRYVCEHGLAFSGISCEKGGIRASKRITVVPGECAEAWEVTVKNLSKSEKTISVFPFMEFNLNGFEQNRYYYAGNTGYTTYLPEENGIFCSQVSPFMPFDYVSGYFLSSEKVDHYTARVEHFTGTAGSMAVPRVLREGKDLPDTDAAVRNRGAILQHTFTLGAGEEKVITFIMGFASSRIEELKARRADLFAKAKEAFRTVYERGVKEFGTLRTVCPDKRVENIMNFWVQKQVSYCMLGKQAVRDNSQIAWGILNYDAPLAKAALVDCISHQWYDGHSMQTWSIGAIEKDIYSDPGTWMLLATCDYIKESGDLAFLDERIPYTDHESETLYEHVKKAAAWFMRKDNFGPHGMPRIHHADWNDALNLPDEQGESVFMAMLILCVMNELVALAKKIGDKTNAKKWEAFRKELAARTNEVAWNGDYYVRAFSKAGVVGDKTSKNGGNVYCNPQVWAILAGIVPEDRMEKVLATIDAMDTESGVPILAPAYTSYDPNIGRMSAMPAGVYENGGIYNHACAFKVMADAKIGRGDKAVGTLLKMIPGGHKNPSEITTTEPYVFTNCYLKHPAEDMVVGFSWQTGSSAWALRSYYEGVLGISRTYEGLAVSPNLPADWKRVELTRLYRGATLHVVIENRGGKRVSIVIDGKRAKGNVIPPFADGGEHKIVVRMI